ncbi:MAG: DUF3800 domain-containing protein [Pseudomonadota bacterium]|nr:DUF3800 domain-containing protein [Pseudomonadota bacterium]
MELLFIDESGDNGFAPGSTEFFILAGLSIEAIYWKEYFWKIRELKEEISKKYGLRFNEFKASDIFQHRGAFFNAITTTEDLLNIYIQLIDLICLPAVSPFATIKSKNHFRQYYGPKTPKEILIKQFNKDVWNSFLLMYDEFLYKKSVDHQTPQTAIVYSDNNSGQEKQIRATIREFARRYNTQRPFPETGIVEDVIFRDSKSSPLIQLTDVLAFSLTKLKVGKSSSDVIEIPVGIKDRLMKKLENHLHIQE